jgi:hypothetical protein
LAAGSWQLAGGRIKFHTFWRPPTLLLVSIIIIAFYIHVHADDKKLRIWKAGTCDWSKNYSPEP